uniref:AT5G23395 protein n=1 Tax=Arabidopsis thaliana TaxID=3702 RepID=C0Z3J3_ARATH|nr:AT5G23395 [Arabidopsis thaliana]
MDSLLAEAAAYGEDDNENEVIPSTLLLFSHLLAFLFELPSYLTNTKSISLLKPKHRELSIVLV